MRKKEFPINFTLMAMWHHRVAGGSIASNFFEGKFSIPYFIPLS